jgi:hypothetical protein
MPDSVRYKAIELALENQLRRQTGIAAQGGGSRSAVPDSGRHLHVRFGPRFAELVPTRFHIPDKP